jgi:RNA ligase (TIGR02306 family)
MRKLATVRKIDAIHPINGADAIEAAVVGGWKVVVKKGEYQPGDLAVYCEIDSWIPHDLAPFLSKGQEPREFNGVKGERLRTIKLRGQLSQGLLLPLTVMNPNMHALLDNLGSAEGFDCSEWLNIQKWEAPIPAQLAGEVRGPFPVFIPKTDQERVQNLVDDLEKWDSEGLTFEVTEKLDGTSMTVYVFNEDEGVCSRNLNLRETEKNSLWSVCRREKLIEKIRSTGRNLALQGELIGEGIQGNPYKIKGQQFYLYDIYDIDNVRYLEADYRQIWADSVGIVHVPECTSDVIGYDLEVDYLLKMAEGKSFLNIDAEREGLVFKCEQDPFVSFKVISNRFLLKGGN